MREPARGQDSPAVKIFTGLLTPLSLAIIGFFTTSYLNQRQTADTNARVYADVLSRREEADTGLRKEMFNTVLQQFLRADKSEADRILKLELLAYNFHESLDLGPLFLDVVRNVKPGGEEGALQMKRLAKVAREVKAKQVESLLTDVGALATGQVDLTELPNHPAGNTVIESELKLNLVEVSGYRHPARRFVVEALDQRPNTRELRIRLTVSPPGQTDPTGATAIDVPFWLGLFDFPSIDNTRLSNGERCAVILLDMDETSAQVELVYFPATRTSGRDKLYVEELTEQLLHLRR